MKTHTNNFKNNLIKFGRELDSKITYTQNGTQVELGGEQLNSITPHFEGAILKSVMKQLDIDSNVEIPLNTVINFQFGVKTSNEEVQDYRDNYDYINFGNYVVYNVEKQEDTGSYKITCYDKMLYSMKDYESVGVTYPITIRSYINAICTHLGLTFSNINDTFANYNREIQNELYLDADNNTLGFTFRDVLDQLAQVTASTICINEDDELEIRYINNTNDTINEEYLKDINVNFGEQYGPINTIVLSRSAGSDNVYYPATLPQNPNEIKISDNQIMNFNDRADYLPDIYDKLNGLQYYLNDFASTGITYYDICDRYNVQIGENTYPCIMFNDEINITQGLEENVHTDMPEESETDYTKADKTDRKINQTYLIVNKQLGIIEAKVDEVANISTDASGYGSVTLENIADSEPIEVVVKAIREDISYLYPRNDLFPSDDLYPKERNILFTNGENIITYTIPDDLLHYSDSIYDEFHLDFLNKKCQIIKKCEKKNVVITNNVNLSGVSITFNNSSFLNFYSYMTEELFDSLLNNTLKIIKSDDDHFIGARINRISGSYYTFTIYIFDYDGSYDIFEQEIYRTTNTAGEVVLEPMSTPTLEINEYDLSSDFGTTTEVTSNSLFLNCFTYPDGRIYPKQTIEIIDYEYPTIHLTEGNWTVSLPSFSTSYVYAKMMIKNDYTSQTASKVELNSQITQTKNNINLELSEVLDDENKVTGASLMLAINNDESEAKLEADKISLQGKTINLTSDDINIDSTYFKVSKTGYITATGGTIGGFELGATNFLNNISGLYDYDYYDLRKCNAYILNMLGDEPILKKIVDYNENGTVNSQDLVGIQSVILGRIENTKTISGHFEINSNNPKHCINVYDSNNNLAASLGVGGIDSSIISCKNIICSTANSGGDYTGISMNGSSGKINAFINGSRVYYPYGNIQNFFSANDGDYLQAITSTDTAYGITWWLSDEKLKDNIKDTDVNGLDIITKIEHKQFNKKDEKNRHYKVGYISQQLEQLDKDLIFKVEQPDGTYYEQIKESVLIPYITKAIQEQQEMIKNQQEQINQLKEEIRKIKGDEN